MSGIYLSTTPQPGGGPGMNIVVGMTPFATGDKLRIIVDYVDASNFLFLEATAGTGGTLAIWRKAGGADTLKKSIGAAIPAGTTTIVGLCITADGLVAAASVGTTPILTGVIVSATNPGWGLGTGGTLAGTATFGISFTRRTDDSCGNCASLCPDCFNGLMSAEYQVSIPPAFTANGCTGPQCASVSGTYYIPMIVSGCTGNICTPAYTCVGDLYVYLVFRTGMGGFFCYLHCEIANFGNVAFPGCSDHTEFGGLRQTWFKGYDSAPACTAFINEALAYYNDGGGNTAATCAFDNTQLVLVSSA
jgi:hypothetical protein